MRSFNSILIAAMALITGSCQSSTKEASAKATAIKAKSALNLPDSLSSRRISFVMNLREAVADVALPDFAKKRTEGALVYFNGNRSEVFFPTNKVKGKLVDYEAFSDDYVLAARTDTIPFHFEVMLSFDPSDADQFYYDHPVEQFLSVEEVGNFIPSVQSTEMWATMVIHEMFHHYQYNTPEYLEYAKTEMGGLSFDVRDLLQLCREDEQFLPRIQEENEVLMDAITAETKEVRDSLIAIYLQKRSDRLEAYSKDFPHLEKVENYYVLQEGSARYMEYETMKILNDHALQSDAPGISDDANFKSYEEFRELDLKGETFGFLTYAGDTDYHYTIGFNTMRLLDLLHIDYRDRMLSHPEKGLHAYLEDYMGSL